MTSPSTSLSRRLVFASVPLVLLLGAAEVAARVLPAPDQLSQGGFAGWTARPNLSAFVVVQSGEKQDFTVSTNIDGLRTSAAPARVAGRQRVMVFGESTVFGWGVGDADTPAARLERVLGDGVDVINAGQPGYSSEQAERLAELVLPRYQPDGVVFFVAHNDRRRAEQSDAQLLPARGGVVRQLAGRLPSVGVLGWLRYLGRPEAVDPAIRNDGSEVFALADSREAHGGVERVSDVGRRATLGHLQRTAAENGAWLVVSVLPPGSRWKNADAGDFADRVAADCASLGLPFVDLTDSLGGFPVDSAVLPGDPGHFGGEANHLMMMALAAQLPIRPR